jgi:hypothetical protein
MGDGRGVDDRRGCLAIREEAVEDGGKVVDRSQMELEVEAVLAGDAVAFPDLRNLQRDLGNPMQQRG